MEKENRRPNVVTAPTLFVGVGGTSGRVVKRVAQMCHPEEKVNVDFVCLDTNVNDLNDVATSGIYHVQTSSSQTVGDHLTYDKDARRNWFPNTALIVRALVMLPETLDSVIKSASERESQRRNAYATIKEINAFMMEGSGFFDVDEDLRRYYPVFSVIILGEVCAFLNGLTKKERKEEAGEDPEDTAGAS